MEHDEKLLDADYRAHATAATYTPPGGSAADCRIKLERPTARAGAKAGPLPAVRFDGAGIGFETNAQALSILVRASEVTPVRGGVFELSGRSYEIMDDPQPEDPEALEWRCGVERP